MSVLDKTFLTDEEWFRLNGYINSLNTCVWAMENSLTFHEAPPHTEKISVWSAVLCSLWDPCFFESTVDGTVYRDLVKQFVALLELDEHHCFSQTVQPDSKLINHQHTHGHFQFQHLL